MSSIINMTFLITFFLTILTFSSANHHPKEKETNLQFYYHELLAGPNKTLLTVVRQNSTALGSFGDISVFDDNLRAGPEQYSKVVGYSQGTAVQSSQHRGLEFVLNMNWFFTEGKYNGSSLAVFGRAAFTDVRELSIVGGTGVFRLARGVVIGRPLDAPPASFIISYDVQVFHY